MNYIDTDAVAPALTWLRTLINCPAVQWSPGQQKAAVEAYTKAVIQLPSSCRLSPFVDVTSKRELSTRYLNDTDHTRYVRVLSSVLGAVQVITWEPGSEEGRWNRHSYNEPLAIPPGGSYKMASSFVSDGLNRPVISVWEETP